ncbi:MAG: cation diffusion facilitator family transporter [Candidatus Erginobacter occultus]|nr:cation diffusion facilitator family transporter [Candidatus Erginobacter occultus]
MIRGREIPRDSDREGFGPGVDAYEKGARAAWVGIAGNIFLSLIKFLSGILGHSAAMVADGVHSLSDILSSGIVLAGMKMARKSPDHEHPYGHGKAESVAAQAVSLFLIFLGGMIFYNSVRGLSRPTPPAPANYVLVIAAVSILVKEGLFRYKIRLGKRLGSSSLIADAWHHRSDAFSSIAVLVGVALAILGGPRFHIADHLAAMAVAGIICYTGIKLLLKTSSELLDRVVDGEAAEEIGRLAAQTAGVERVEKLLVRKSGLELMIDIHIEVDPALSVVEGHRIAGRVKGELMGRVPALKSVLVHVEPHRPALE